MYSIAAFKLPDQSGSRQAQTLVLLDHYLQLGYRLIPLKPNSKEPLIKGWPEKASSDPKQIEAWARAYPGCGWGLVLDERTLALDVDDTARLGDLLATYPELDGGP